MPLKVQGILISQGENKKCTSKKYSMDFYTEMKSYREKWINPFERFKNFDWMLLTNITYNTPWSQIENTVTKLQNLNIDIDENKLMDEWTRLKAFSINLSPQERLLTASQLWVNFFKRPNGNLCTEMQKIAQYFFYLPAHNANVERIFSTINQRKNFA